MWDLLIFIVDTIADYPPTPFAHLHAMSRVLTPDAFTVPQILPTKELPFQSCLSTAAGSYDILTVGAVVLGIEALVHCAV